MLTTAAFVPWKAVGALAARSPKLTERSTRCPRRPWAKKGMHDDELLKYRPIYLSLVIDCVT